MSGCVRLLAPRNPACPAHERGCTGGRGRGAPWRECSEKAVLRAKEQQIRGLVAELYERTKDAADADYRGIVRRSLVECKHLLDLAADSWRAFGTVGCAKPKREQTVC